MSEGAMSTEDVRRELAEAEARVERVRAENARLERLLMRPTFVGARTAICILAAGIAGITGYLGAARIGEMGDGRKAAVEGAAHAQRLAEERLAQGECKNAIAKTNDALAICRGERSTPQLTPRKPKPCTCQSGDPLCSCL
jgi:hypothetical protein